MKRLLLALGCVAFLSASAFAKDCCSGKKKEGGKTEDSTKQSFAEAR